MNEEARKYFAWMAAASVQGRSDVRVDCDGRFIAWNEYGLTSPFGWELDHIFPSSIGGVDTIYNLRARHWLGNRSAGGALGAALNVLRKSR